MRYLIIILVLASLLFAHELSITGKDSYTGLEVTEQEPVNAMMEGNVMIVVVLFGEDDMLMLNDPNDPNANPVGFAKSLNIKQTLKRRIGTAKRKIADNATLAELREKIR